MINHFIKCACVLLAAMASMTPAMPAQAAGCDAAVAAPLIVPFINDAPESSRVRQTHRYGARYIEIRRKAISLDHTLLDPYHKNIFLVGQLPAAHFASTRTLDLALTVELLAPPTNLQFIIGVEFSDGFVFAAQNGAWVFERKAFVKKDRVAKSQIPPGELKLFDFSQTGILTTPGCDRYTIGGITALIAKHGGPKRWFFISPNKAKDAIQIQSLGLTVKSPSPSGKLIWGEVRFPFMPRPAVVKVRYENKQERTVYLSTDNKFAFEREFPGEAMSVRLLYGHDVAYPERGRWFGRAPLRGPLVINVGTRFQNLGASRVDPKVVVKRGYRSRLRKNPIGFEGHVLSYWAGAYKSIQEFENWHFTNYNGFHDRDWDPQNRNKCLRVAHIGQSIVQARQVAVSEKHSTLASERLSVLMGRCVEVASFSSGLTPSSERAIDWIVAQFKPDVLLFSAHRQMMQLATPELATAVFGAAHGHAHFDTFELKDGKLAYVPMDPKHHLAKKVKTQPVIDGVPTSLVFNLPLDVMPGIGARAFKTLEATMEHYHKKYNNVAVALEYSHTPAECKKASYCQRRQAVNGKTYQAGAVGFIRNMEALCARSVVQCVSSAIPPDSIRTYPDIVYQYDTHLTAKGNAWQANILSKGLKPILDKLVE